MFRLLSEQEEIDFRNFARQNYTPTTEINELWHPVIRDECRRMREENQKQSEKTEIEYRNSDEAIREESESGERLFGKAGTPAMSEVEFCERKKAKNEKKDRAEVESCEADCIST